jgi:hypothetical protein
MLLGRQDEREKSSKLVAEVLVRRDLDGGSRSARPLPHWCCMGRLEKESKLHQWLGGILPRQEQFASSVLGRF